MTMGDVGQNAPASPAERPETATLPKLTGKLDAIGRQIALDLEDQFDAVQLAWQLSEREAQLLTTCNNYEKLRTSHENLIEMVESVQNRLEIVEKWRGATWKEVRTEIWDDSFSAALANAKALAEKMK